MDKSWMGRSRLSKEYELGVEMFIKFGERHANGSTGIKCPCVRCGNFKRHCSQEIRDHLYIYGIDQSYKTWFWHGEELSNGLMDEKVGDDKDRHHNVDKSWMGKSRLSKEYDLGVEMFIKFGERHAKGSTSIRCPCNRCKNRKCHSSEDIRAHLYFHGIDQSYTTWFWHGEKPSIELKIKEEGVIMDKSLDEQKKDYDLKDIMEKDNAAHATNPLMNDYNLNISNTSHIKFDCNKRKTRGPTIMREITQCSSQGDRKVVQYNDYGQPIGVNAAKLRSYIGSCVRSHVPITYATWKHVPKAIKEKIFKLIQAGFVIDGKAKKSILQNAGNSFRQFKSWLTTHYIIPFKNQPDQLENPPDAYSHIESHHWHQFVKSRLSEEFENTRTLQAQRRAQNKYNYRLSRKGYANFFEEMKKKHSIEKAAQINIETEMENIEAEEEDESTSKDVDTKPKVAMNSSCDYVSTQTSGKPECSDQSKGEGGSSKPSASVKTTKSGPELERMQKNEIDEMVKALHRRVEELEEKMQQQFPPNSECGSCNEQHSEDEVSGPVKNRDLEKDN